LGSLPPLDRLQHFPSRGHR